MGRNYIAMEKVRNLLQLKLTHGLSTREAAHRVGIGKTAASEYVAGFTSSGLTLEEAMALSDSDLAGVLDLKKVTQNDRYQELSIKFEYFEKELKRKGVTLQLLWEEYLTANPQGYLHTQFCYHFEKWKKVQNVSMHIEHKAGDKMYVDFTGVKHKVTDAKTGDVTEYEVFVAVLGCSQKAYLEGTATQTKADWVQANENALRYFKGVPSAIVPDCLKSAVTKADKYDPIINQTYSDFGRHYGTTILPARALHPKDKSLAEGFVRMAYTRIFAPLRDQVFGSIQELNIAFLNQLEIHNNKHFQGRKYSREDLYNDVERKELKPLPVAYYDLKEFKSLTVQYNYYVHLKADLHYYSVPVQYTGKVVLLTYSNRLIEVYYNNIRIALHIRDRRPGEYTVDPAHRPPNHKFIAEWTTERYIAWGQKIGKEAEDVVRMIFESKAHPEQGFRSCMGILSLFKKYPKEDFLKACKKALYTNCVSYRFIANTLKTKSFNLDAYEELRQIGTIIHENIRGKEGYN